MHFCKRQKLEKTTVKKIIAAGKNGGVPSFSGKRPCLLVNKLLQYTYCSISPELKATRK